jgi:hypothetical protein
MRERRIGLLGSPILDRIDIDTLAQLQALGGLTKVKLAACPARLASSVA